MRAAGHPRRAWRAAAAAALVLAGCSTGAVIKSSTVAGSPFCTDIATFATKASVLNDAAAQTSAALLQVLPGIVSSLNALEAEAPANDTVNNKPLKTDIATMARVYRDLINELQHNSNVPSALSTVNARDGQALTDSVGRFDSYAGSVCKVGQATPTLSTSTTAAQTGPTAP
jgi:hypothetical protein